MVFAWVDSILIDSRIIVYILEDRRREKTDVYNFEFWAIIGILSLNLAFSSDGWCSIANMFRGMSIEQKGGNKEKESIFFLIQRMDFKDVL